MSHLSTQDAYLMEAAINPSSADYKHYTELLLQAVDDGEAKIGGFGRKSDWKHIFPFRGDPVDEAAVRAMMPFRFHERGIYRNGVLSLASVVSQLVDLVQVSSASSRLETTLLVSDEFESVQSTCASSGYLATNVFYTDLPDFLYTSLEQRPQTLIVDHTTISVPIDELLCTAYRQGAVIVDGIFPYNVAGIKGWDTVISEGHWSYTHSAGTLTVGPDDDATRMITYREVDYKKFVDPKLWKGKARTYGYEIRNVSNGLATYRAVYLGGQNFEIPRENLSFSLPVCSNDDMVLITINRDLASGVFASKSNNAQELASLAKNYSIEMRRDLFTSCVDFLIAKERNSDIIAESIRYISNHNYVDLVDGVKVVRAHSLKYADALCASMVCSLVAYALRYRLTNESLPDINRNLTAARLAHQAPLGALGRLAWYMWTAVADPLYKAYHRTRERAAELLHSTDYIPGICYDVYVGTDYKPDLEWFEPYELIAEQQLVKPPGEELDAFTSYMGEAEKTSALTMCAVKPLPLHERVVEHKYVPNLVVDPVTTLQDFYDEVLPHNSTAQIQNVSELRRIRDVNVNTEFYGKIEINKDVAAPELLHEDSMVRTSAVPISRTSLVDAIMASSKRNFNPPDLQDQSDPWKFASYLVDKFIDWAFVPNYKTTLATYYKKDPITFNVADYLDWKSSHDAGYRSAMEAECPEELIELSLEKYDTIVKKRIKPKLSTTNQTELSQPQVLVNMSKKDTGLFSSVFRRVFERFDSALRPELMSAGRASDKDISDWLTEFQSRMEELEIVEMDSAKYDKSQGLLARMVESLLMLELGLDPGVQEIFKDSYVGKVSSRALGLMFISAYQMKSGAPHTMLGNVMYNFISAMESVGPENIAFMIVKGDDNLIWLIKHLRGHVNKEMAVSKMSGLFNLEVKLISGSVPYFSSGYVVKVDGATLFVSDPVKMVQLLGEPTDERTMREQFTSFQDRVVGLTQHHALPHRLQDVVRSRMVSPALDVVSAIDALAAVAERFKLFSDIKSGRTARSL